MATAEGLQVHSKFRTQNDNNGGDMGASVGRLETSQTTTTKGHSMDRVGSSIASEADHTDFRQTSVIDLLDENGLRELQRELTQHRDVKSNDYSEATTKYDLELGDINYDNFDMRGYLTAMMERSRTMGYQGRTMPISFEGVTVRGRGNGVAEAKDLSHVLNPLGAVAAGHNDRQVIKNIITDVWGSVDAGEMLLVLGIPGSGCTTFMKTLIGYHEGYESVEGDISYAGFDQQAISTFLRGDAVYCGEDDVHFPTLSVQETLAFAVATRAPPSTIRKALNPNASRDAFVSRMYQIIGTVLGLRRVFDTKVGDELIRGISGGQKKRVSIGEVLASHAKILAFDNSTRGLDASTAVDFVKALRVATDVAELVTVATTYQAGDQIVLMFDKVTILYTGHQIFFGRIDEALEYFDQLGFERRFGQSIGDFLVSVTDPASRNIRNGFEPKVAWTAEAMSAAWKDSTLGRRNVERTKARKAEMMDTYNTLADNFKQTVKSEKAKHQRDVSKYSISFNRQIRLALHRRYRMMMGDLAGQAVVFGANTIQALIVGSVYVNSAPTTASFFSRSGVLFFALLLNALTAMTEVALGYKQRPIVIRQSSFGMIRPSADAIANNILMLPVKLFQLTPFVLIIYFMTGLSRTADAFFIFYGVIVLTTYTVTAFFRMLSAILGDISKATMIAGLAVIDFVLYTGYTISRPNMVVWWRWLSYCNPLAFAYEILISNEFRKLGDVQCAQTIPAGPAYAGVSAANRVCPVVGSVPGRTVVDAQVYLSASYGYEFSNAGRNAGILFGFWIAFMIVQAWGADHQKDPLASGGAVLFKKGSVPSAASLEAATGQKADSKKKPEATKARTETNDVFAWEDLVYEVPVENGTRRLLNKVSGYVKPGTLTALMGESGAGKTTLLNVLAERTDVGVITGSRTVNGLPLQASFQADTGYCQQQDNHLATATVREALEFSALLRQPAQVSTADKLAYVDQVIDLLQMGAFQDALVGQVGEGLSVEQRKRLTIGVELAARPKLLLFLDEPTSGLSAQASWGIVQFLKKLAQSGQAILCTIHQPSGELINEFDRLLLLRRGGETVFFGDLGEHSSNMVDYFARHSGMECDETMNPAEFMLDAIAKPPLNTEQDWHQVYIASDLHFNVLEELSSMRSVQKLEDKAKIENSAHSSVYASSLGTQFFVLFKRTRIHFWRSPNYITAKLGLNILAGLFIGSSFWNAGSENSQAALQNKIFATFMALILSTSQAQQTQAFFLGLRDLFDAREQPSKAYSWVMMILTFILIEILYNFVSTTFFWIPWYYMVRYGDASKLAAYSWGMMMLFSTYWCTFAVAIASMAGNAATASTLFSSFFSFVLIFCGVAQPPPEMPTFWRSWMPPLSPFTYIIMGLMGNTLNGQVVECSEQELSTIIPPGGQTCSDFLDTFINTSSGYYVQKTDGGCGYCPYREGNDYWTRFSTSTFTYSSAYRYRNIGIVVAFVGFNFLLIFALFWLFRIRRSSGRLKLISRMLGLFKKD